MNAALTPEQRQNVERLLESMYGEIRAVVTVEALPGSSGARLSVKVHSRSIKNEPFDDQVLIWRAAEYELRLLALLAMQGVALPPVVFGKPDKDRNGDVIMLQLPQWHGPGKGLAAALASIHARNAGQARAWMRTVASADDALAPVDFRSRWQAGLADAAFRSAVAPFAEALRRAFDATAAGVEEAVAAGPASLLHLGHQAADLRDRSGKPVLMEWASAMHGPVHLDAVLRLPQGEWAGYADALAALDIPVDREAFVAQVERLALYPTLVRLAEVFDRWLDSREQSALDAIVDLLKTLPSHA